MDEPEIELVFEPMSRELLIQVCDITLADATTPDISINSPFGYVDLDEAGADRTPRRVVFYPALMHEARARKLWAHLWWRHRHEAPDAVAHGCGDALIEHYEPDHHTPPRPLARISLPWAPVGVRG